jgi:Flp pilus assembly protein TadD
VVELIKDNDLANWARIAIATEYANAGQLEQALQVADTIQTTEKRSSNNGTNPVETLLKNQTLAELAVLYAQAERFPQALQIAQTIESAGLKDQVLIAIAKQQAKAGQYSSAIQVANRITDARHRNPWLQLLTCANQTALLPFKIQN